MKILYLKAKDFTNSESFCSNTCCPVAMAAKRQFNTEEVTEGVHLIMIDDVSYSHDEYNLTMYYEDKETAAFRKPDSTVRTLILTEVVTSEVL